MSYREVGTTVTLTWKLHPTTNVPAKADLDIVLEIPDGTTIYTDDAVRTYVAPTATTDGFVTYDLYLQYPGRYVVELTVGGSAAYTRAARRELYAVVVPLHVKNGIGPLLYQGPGVVPPPAPVLGYSGGLDTSAQGDFIWDAIFGDSGTKVYVNDWSSTVSWIYQYNCVTPYSVIGATYSGKSFVVGQFRNMQWNSDGTLLYYQGGGFSNINGLSLSTAWDISTASGAGISIDPGGTNNTALTIANNGTMLFLIYGNSQFLARFTLTTPYDLSSVHNQSPDRGTSLVGTLDLTGTGMGVEFSDDGFVMWLLDDGANLLRRYVLNTAWDFTTANPSTFALNVTPATSVPRGARRYTGNPDIFLISTASNATVDQYEWS